MIPAATVDAALRWIRQNIFGERGLTDFFGDVFFARESLACGFVLYEFDTEQQAQASNFADVRVRFKRLEMRAQLLRDCRHMLE